MKKILLYTALGAMTMLASCSQDESLDMATNHGGELSFRTIVNYATRGNVADVNIVKENGFKVTAFLYGMDGGTKKVQTAPYFNDMEVTWNETWEHAKRYWPGSNEFVDTNVPAKGFDFVAYSPAATTGVTYDDKKMLVTDYTIPADVADEKDLVVANAQNQNETDNGIDFVLLNFKHVLSQIEVKASNASNYYHIDIEKVEIHNVHGKGTLTYDYAADSPVAWSATDAAVSSNVYTSAPESAAPIGATATSLHKNENYFMMLPQTAAVWAPETQTQTAAGAYFVVSCKIYTGSGTDKEYLFGVGDANNYGRVAIPVPANGTGQNQGKLCWEPGKKYTYTLEFFKEGAGFQEPGTTAPAASIVPSNVLFSTSVSIQSWSEESVSEDPCFPAGTKITMADGTQKNIEDINYGDMVRTFNHEVGAFSSAQICCIFQGPKPAASFTLTFASGSSLKIVGKHDLLEKNSRKYVPVTYNCAAENIGKSFYNTVTNAWDEVTNVTYNTEKTNCYSIYSAYHINTIADDFLSAPYDAGFNLNIYELDENLKADPEQLAADIAQYGLCTADDFPKVVNYKEMFNALNRNSKIALGKGLISLSQYNIILEAYK